MITHGLGASQLENKQPTYICMSQKSETSYCIKSKLSSLTAKTRRIGGFGMVFGNNVKVCGGTSDINADEGLLTCDTLESYTVWQHLSDTINISRTYSAYASAPNGDWYITGGFSVGLEGYLLGQPLDSTIAYTSHDTPKVTPKLPFRLGCHCMLHVEDKYFAIFGGMKTHLDMTSSQAYYINYRTGDYMNIPYLHTGRANHGCFKVYSRDNNIRVSHN